jgi:ribulose-phosphate 3-epimerase
MIDKVKEIRDKLDALGSQAFLQVDGGMSVETLPLVYKAGANVFVVGNFAFKHPLGVAEAIRLLRDCVRT